VIVPRQNRMMGWTLNWAHSTGVRQFFLGIVLIVAILWLASISHDPRLEGGATAIVILSIVFICYRFSQTERFEDPDL
jgi:MFS-type transporter involved in bile tolerance (Atg22 family)